MSNSKQFQSLLYPNNKQIVGHELKETMEGPLGYNYYSAEGITSQSAKYALIKAGFAVIEDHIRIFGANHYYLELMLLDFKKQKPYDFIF